MEDKTVERRTPVAQRSVMKSSRSWIWHKTLRNWLLSKETKRLTIELINDLIETSCVRELSNPVTSAQLLYNFLDLKRARNCTRLPRRFLNKETPLILQWTLCTITHSTKTDHELGPKVSETFFNSYIYPSIAHCTVCFLKTFHDCTISKPKSFHINSVTKIFFKSGADPPISCLHMSPLSK